MLVALFPFCEAGLDAETRVLVGDDEMAWRGSLLVLQASAGVSLASRRALLFLTSDVALRALRRIRLSPLSEIGP